MRCPHCQTDNPDKAKFCLNCGTPLANKCANCQSELPAGARFCMNCGQPVSAASTPVEEERFKRVAAATPEPLAQKMKAAHLAGERKIVTCLFADVVGSTTLAEKFDPEDWTEIMNKAFDRISPAIYKYEGTIARLLGDAILAFFGAPLAHEDDPSRACRAALEILAQTQTYAEEVRRKHGIEFQMRIGLNTGPVVVGEVGSNLKFEYTAMGDAVNLAARMQSAAKPMKLLVSEHTYRFIAPMFDCTDLGPIEVKGKAELVRVYEVNRAKAEPGRVRGLAGLESPMVGRDLELKTVLDATAALQSQSGRAVAVIAEAGLGKSRLIAEWKKTALGETSKSQLPITNYQWAEGHCLSYGQGLPYHLLIDLLRSLIGIPAAASEPETNAALEAQCRALFGEAYLDVYPYLGHLLSLNLEGAALERVKPLDPQALQAQYLAGARKFLQGLAAQRPLILICDDTHWADPSSTELLTKLLPLTLEVPVLFAFITRPDHEAPGWKLLTAARETLGDKFAELPLHPLTEADSRQLVANLLEIEALPDNIRNIILKKAEGNPFFVEEVIRMLIERGAILKKDDKSWMAGKEIETIEIPNNLQGLLLARIDRLPDDVKRTLRVASVIGRQFPVKVLEQVLEKS